mmetsp:Transcript_10893/g.45349  ORF Transcript_10893/g.45349 Transcript_10893/m.45349 type:complete len:257 (-) Transcript_10893:119-889(-)
MKPCVENPRLPVSKYIVKGEAVSLGKVEPVFHLPSFFILHDVKIWTTGVVWTFHKFGPRLYLIAQLLWHVMVRIFVFGIFIDQGQPKLFADSPQKSVHDWKGIPPTKIKMWHLSQRRKSIPTSLLGRQQFIFNEPVQFQRFSVIETLSAISALLASPRWVNPSYRAGVHLPVKGSELDIGTQHRRLLWLYLRLGIPHVFPFVTDRTGRKIRVLIAPKASLRVRACNFSPGWCVPGTSRQIVEHCVFEILIQHFRHV